MLVKYLAMVQIDLKALKAFVERLPAAAILRFEDQWMMNAEVLELTGYSYSHRQPLEKWLSQLQPLQGEDLIRSFFDLHEDKKPVTTVIRTKSGQLRWLDIQGMHWNGARIWLLLDRGTDREEMEKLRRQNEFLEARLSRQLDEYAKAINLLLAARRELEAKNALLAKMASRNGGQAEDLER
ncbi:MAG: hypothetical protein IPN20_23835 [Haliscomenobacter sp.]|nr:hypothetical protein [Haliscomenobacter sp.]